MTFPIILLIALVFILSIGLGLAIGFRVGANSERTALTYRSESDNHYARKQTIAARSKAFTAISEDRINDSRLSILALPQSIQQEATDALDRHVQEVERYLLSSSEAIVESEELSRQDATKTQDYERSTERLESAMHSINYSLRTLDEDDQHINERIEQFSATSLRSVANDLLKYIDRMQAVIKDRRFTASKEYASREFQQFSRNVSELRASIDCALEMLRDETADRGMIGAALIEYGETCEQLRKACAKYDDQHRWSLLLQDIGMGSRGWSSKMLRR